VWSRSGLRKTESPAGTVNQIQDLETLLTALYVVVDDHVIPRTGRKPGRPKHLSDAELVCLICAQHLLQVTTERRWIRYAHKNLRGLPGFIDAIRVKFREGTVTNRPIYIALAVTTEGMREISGIWAGEPGDGEGAKYWLRILTEIRNRGVKDTLMVVCDGPKGLPDSVEAVWPDA
jgi:hypothetical protein